MKICGIYRITCIVNGKVYIGSSEDVGHRLVAHRSVLRKGTHSAVAMQRSWNKYGAEAFRFEVIETCAQADLLVREQHHIDAHRSADPKVGFNVCRVAGTRRGVPQPPSVAEKMRAFHTGKPKSAETRAKMSAAAKGRPKSAAHRAAISAATKAAMANPELREHLSRKATEQFSTPEARAALAERSRRQMADPAVREHLSVLACARAKTPEGIAHIESMTAASKSPEAIAKMRSTKTGVTHSDEARRRMSEAHKARWAARKAQT